MIKELSKPSFHQVSFFPKPVHPGYQAHLWFGSKETSHPDIEGLLKDQSSFDPPFPLKSFKNAKEGRRT
jgi:hypothetical protein